MQFNYATGKELAMHGRCNQCALVLNFFFFRSFVCLLGCYGLMMGRGNGNDPEVIFFYRWEISLGLLRKGNDYEDIRSWSIFEALNFLAIRKALVIKCR